MARRALVREEEIKLMVRCAQLYYGGRHELSQAEVATRLKINPTKVSRLLRQAHSEGIVRVAIDPPRLQRLELELMETFGLREALVVPSAADEAYDAVGKAAAGYFSRVARDNISIGLAPGYSVQKMIEHLEQLDFKEHTLYPLAAESTSILAHFYPTQLAAMMMTKYRDPSKTTAFTYRIPTKPDDHHDLLAYKAFLPTLVKGRTFTRLLEQARSADLLFMGVGSMESLDPGTVSFLRAYGLSPNSLSEYGAVGLINYQPYDSEGRILDSQSCPILEEMEASMVWIGLEDFRKAAKSFGRSAIALAGSAYKLKAVRAAIKGGFFNVLITDTNLAEGLLDSGPVGD